MGASIAGLCAYAVIAGFVVTREPSLRGVLAEVVGWSLIIAAKTMEPGHPDNATLARRAGYITLLMSPSYTHPHDALALVGYSMALLGMHATAAVPIAMHLVMGLAETHSAVHYATRAAAAGALALGYTNPLV